MWYGDSKGVVVGGVTSMTAVTLGMGPSVLCARASMKPDVGPCPFLTCVPLGNGGAVPSAGPGPYSWAGWPASRS